jgi:REP element-mobilizing transposase RayT
MPRHARVLSETQTYHIMLRGNNRQDVFIDDEDKARIIATISEKKGSGRFVLYAYCVMDNHLHLVLKEGTDPLSRALKRIGTSYAYYFNKRYKRVGHVFQDRYRSENIEDDAYLLGAIRYIHRSSYHEYSKEGADLVAVDEILSMFSNDRERAIDAFKKYHQEEAEGFFLDVEEKKRILEENVQSFTSQYLIKQKLELEGLKLSENKKFRDELIGLLRKESDLSLRRIAEVLHINREVVRRAVASLSKEPSP